MHCTLRGFIKLHTISTLEKPIYVTENGVADQGNNIREIFIKRYLYAFKQSYSRGAKYSRIFLLDFNG